MAVLMADVIRIGGSQRQTSWSTSSPPFLVCYNENRGAACAPLHPLVVPAVRTTPATVPSSTCMMIQQTTRCCNVVRKNIPLCKIRHHTL
jgi:hypothetical protein